MRPALSPNDRLIMRRIRPRPMDSISYTLDEWGLLKYVNFDYSKIRHGDIVVYKSIKNPNQLDVKRVLALSRDEITPQQLQIQQHVKPKPKRIKENYVWLEGDNQYGNRQNFDSTSYGQIPIGNIVGVVTGVLTFNASIFDGFHEIERLERKVPKERIKFSQFVDKNFIENLGQLDQKIGGSKTSAAAAPNDMLLSYFKGHIEKYGGDSKKLEQVQMDLKADAQVLLDHKSQKASDAPKPSVKKE